MTENGHTPGPWEMRDVSQNWLEILSPLEGGSSPVIATVLPTQYAVLGKSPEQFANARLIAAAPELLRILEHIALRLNLEETENPGRVYILAARREEINNIIAKAKGAKRAVLLW